LKRHWLIFLIAILVPLASSQDRRLVRESNRRVALVVGNADYPTSPLRNPVNDAQALSASLRQVGFEVMSATNTNLQALDRAVSSFTSSLRKDDVALFYYAGHGLQVEGENYLVPVDFRADQEADLPYQAYPAGRVLERMQASGAVLSIVIMDACRNNPFRTTRSGVKGLAAMNTGKGSFIAFSTAPGATADDNQNDTNGLFTKFLLEALRQADLKLSDIFDQVRERVYEASGGKQLPWTGSSVIGTFVFQSSEDEARAAAEERAKLEHELQDLEGRIADAKRRNVEREAAQREQEAAALQARLKFQKEEEDRLQREAEQHKQVQQRPAGASTAELARLKELRQKRIEEQAQLQTLTRQNMTLSQAQQELASLEGKVAEIRKQVQDERDRAIARLDSDYTPQRDKLKQPVVKDTFETTAQWQARVAAQRTEATELEKRYKSEREAIESRYAGESALETKEYPARIDELKGGTYLMPGARLAMAGYDADKSLLRLKLNGQQVQFMVPPDKARILTAQLKAARVEAGFGTVLVLVDGSTGERFARYVGRNVPDMGHTPAEPKPAVGPASVQESLKSRYPEARVLADGSRQSRAILIVKQAGIKSYPFSSGFFWPNYYKADDQVRQPRFMSYHGGAPLNMSEMRFIPVGQEVLIRKLTIKDAEVAFRLETPFPNAYLAELQVRFENRFLSTHPFPDVQKIIEQVLALK